MSEKIKFLEKPIDLSDVTKLSEVSGRVGRRRGEQALKDSILSIAARTQPGTSFELGIIPGKEEDFGHALSGAVAESRRHGSHAIDAVDVRQSDERHGGNTVQVSVSRRMGSGAVRYVVPDRPTSLRRKGSIAGMF